MYNDSVPCPSRECAHRIPIMEFIEHRSVAKASIPIHTSGFKVSSSIHHIIDTQHPYANYSRMCDTIYPRSPRETMNGWMHLPRFVDKIRLHLAGKLHADYQANFCKGFDGLWLETAGVGAEPFIEVVRRSITDGEVCDCGLHNVTKPDSVKSAHRE